MKIAGHDLKAMSYLFGAWLPDLYFPLVALVDYRGYRLVAMTVLPINGLETLIYGSSDAGITTFQDENVHEQLITLGKRLNLREHPIKGTQVRCITPIDLEVHQGTDGKYYLLFLKNVTSSIPFKRKDSWIFISTF